MGKPLCQHRPGIKVQSCVQLDEMRFKVLLNGGTYDGDRQTDRGTDGWVVGDDQQANILSVFQSWSLV